MTYPSPRQYHWDHYARYIKCIYGQVGGDLFHNRGADATVYITPVQVPFEVTVDRIIAIIRALIGGNVRVGIYEDNGDTPVGGALVVESASVLAGVVNQKNEYTIANTTLLPNLYWLAIQANAACEFFDVWFPFTQGGTLTTHYYAQAYGVFTDPCPATDTDTDVPQLWLRVASVP